MTARRLILLAVIALAVVAGFLHAAHRGRVGEQLAHRPAGPPPGDQLDQELADLVSAG